MGNILTFRPPDAMRDALRRLSKARGLTVNALLIMILHDWLKENEKHDRPTGVERRNTP